jgi:hypothetical protein
MSNDSSAGEKTVIKVPRPPASAFNPARPISSLISSQLQQIRHAESARVAKHKRGGKLPADLRTESDAAAYIAAVTKVLHPQRRKKSKPRPSR